MKAGPILAVVGGLLWAALLVLAPSSGLAGGRIAFLFVEAPSAGALALLLIARLTGAAWDAALRPLLAPIPWLALAAVPMVVQQALFVVPPAHLTIWLSWPFFAVRTAIAIGFWWWASRRNLSVTGAGLALVAHAVIVDIVAVDWVMGVAPGQPETAIGMALAVAQILAACAFVCLLRIGPDRVRRDLSYLLIAACLGLTYLLFVDFLVVWYGNLPSRIGWYLVRRASPWSVLPPLALLLGLAAPIAFVAIRRGEGSRIAAGAGALGGMFWALCWLVGPIGGAWAILGALAALLLWVPLWRVR